MNNPDTSFHVDQIVQSILGTVTNQVQAQVSNVITQQIAQAIEKIDITALVSAKLNEKIEERLGRLPIDAKTIQSQLVTKVDQLSLNLAQQVQATAVSKINESILGHINKVDFPRLCQVTLAAAIQNKQITFPENSIPATAVQFDRLVLSGDSISGGIIKNFGSTGIDDKATNCQLTILDEATVIENNLLTQNLTVKGSAVIEGDLSISGTVDPTSPFYINVVNAAIGSVRAGIDATMFQSYSDVVFEKIKTQGLDLNRITVQGQSVIEGNSLGVAIINSNLQKVGQLKELQVSGETLLSQTLYTTNTRVGVNTVEPSHALSVWDEEVSVVVGKLSVNTGVIGTMRPHNLILSSNGKNNITLNPDGSVAMESLQLGVVSMTSSTTPPGYEAPHGSIVFNASPSLGGPLGWVSLGSARWANFGIVE